MDNEELKKQTDEEGETQMPSEPQPAPDEQEQTTEETAPMPMPEPEPDAMPSVDAATQAAPAEKMFTQEELNRILQQRLAETKTKALEEGRRQGLADLYSKYGVDDDGGLDELFGNGQRYDILNGEYSSQSRMLSDLKAENALLMSGIDRSKFDDVKAILAYSGQEVTPVAIEQALATHPEWLGQTANTPAMPMSTPMDGGLDAGMAPDPTQSKPSLITKLGSEPRAPEPKDDEKTIAMKLMGY